MGESIATMNELDYIAFARGLYYILRPMLSISLDVFMQLDETKRAYETGKSAEQIGIDVALLMRHRTRQASRAINNPRRLKKK